MRYVGCIAIQALYSSLLDLTRLNSPIDQQSLGDPVPSMGAFHVIVTRIMRKTPEALSKFTRYANSVDFIPDTSTLVGWKFLA